MVFGAFFSLVGFRMSFFGLGAYLGWANDEAIERVFKVSGALLVMFIII